jgi:hypothetical protein
MEYYPATKKNEILLDKAKWMELENTILSEIRQTQKDKCYIISFAYRIYKERVLKHRIPQKFPRTRAGELLLKGHNVSSRQQEYALRFIVQQGNYSK